VATSRDPFDSLTRSALDFVAVAARQIKSSPKYAVINLATAIELVLKARLVHEHWALVVNRPEKASLSTFQNGSFHSVGAEEAIERLRNIAGQVISREEEACFRELRDHRNKLIHFYHEDYLETPNAAALSTIAAEQCRAWFFLRRLLEVRWVPIFDAYKKEIGRIQKLIEKNREYLDGKYLALKPDIEIDIKKGTKYESCAACGHLTSRLENRAEPLVASACAVCGRHNDFLNVPCPKCGADIRIEELGEGECTKCGYKTTLTWLVEKYGPYKDPKEDPETGYCSYCENLEARSVIPLGDMLLCVSCLEEHARIDQCEWCSAFVAGDLEGSYLSGCVMCSGKMGWDSD
jgi:hypothetical protein